MGALKSSFYGAVLCLAAGFMNLTSADETIEFKVGHDHVLPCNVPQTVTGDLRVLKWERDGQEDYVFYFRGDKPVDSFQNPLYRGRVKLEDQQMTNGKMSIILSDFTEKDEGTYTCRVVKDTEWSKTFLLKRKDEPKPEPDNNLGLKVGLPVGLLLAVGALIGGFLFVRSKKGGSML